MKTMRGKGVERSVTWVLCHAEASTSSGETFFR
jgi:hypothetical protein